ncbi:hypothetical protein [Methylomonas koyamae]|uniref:hypothetical protein n=1 Tax=Methylomonas koyamae TaxID=702114 RepID=UPI0021103E0F|nr:hypothetical protein [Methylomonas koyamae]
MYRPRSARRAALFPKTLLAVGLEVALGLAWADAMAEPAPETTDTAIVAAAEDVKPQLKPPTKAKNRKSPKNWKPCKSRKTAAAKI